MSFSSCPQIYIYFLITVISYVLLFNVRGGFDIFLEWEKYNWYIDVGAIIVFTIIIQLLCYSRFQILAWILLLLTIVANIIGIAYRKQVIEADKKLLDIQKKTNKNYFDATKEMVKKSQQN